VHPARAAGQFVTRAPRSLSRRALVLAVKGADVIVVGCF
jgi:hypothetical protein